MISCLQVKRQFCNVDSKKFIAIEKASSFSFTVLFIVYDLRAQNLRFVAPIPEQIGTPTMHFLELSGGQLGKCMVVVAVCSGMGATNCISRAPTDFRS